MNTIIQIANASDVGRVRKANEDYFAAYSGVYGSIIIVCDGMGGHKGGKVASTESVKQIKLHFDTLGENYEPAAELTESLKKANKRLLGLAQEDPELYEMGSTAVLLLVKDKFAHVAHVGDSRCYRIRNKHIEQLTVDHSLVQQMVDAGMITAEQAKDHPKKNVIVRSLGADSKHTPDISEPIELYNGDIFLLCSDGLTGYVNDAELLQYAQMPDTQSACLQLISLANERGGRDNITLQIVSVTDPALPKKKALFSLPLQKSPAKNKNLLFFISGFFTFFAIAALVYFVFLNKNTTPPKITIESKFAKPFALGETIKIEWSVSGSVDSVEISYRDYSQSEKNTMWVPMDTVSASIKFFNWRVDSVHLDSVAIRVRAKTNSGKEISDSVFVSVIKKGSSGEKGLPEGSANPEKAAPPVDTLSGGVTENPPADTASVNNTKGGLEEKAPQTNKQPNQQKPKKSTEFSFEIDPFALPKSLPNYFDYFKL